MHTDCQERMKAVFKDDVGLVFCRRYLFVKRSRAWAATLREGTPVCTGGKMSNGWCTFWEDQI